MVRASWCVCCMPWDVTDPWLRPAPALRWPVRSGSRVQCHRLGNARASRQPLQFLPMPSSNKATVVRLNNWWGQQFSEMPSHWTFTSCVLCYNAALEAHEKRKEGWKVWIWQSPRVGCLYCFFNFISFFLGQGEHVHMPFLLCRFLFNLDIWIYIIYILP